MNNWISIKLSLKTNKIKLKKKSSLKLIKLSCVHAIQIKPRKWKAGPGPIKQVDYILSMFKVCEHIFPFKEHNRWLIHLACC